MLTGGLDEVGYGAWAGPYVSVVYVTREDFLAYPTGVRDSKKCTPEGRRLANDALLKCAYDIGLGYASAEEIDIYGAFPALQLSYRRALADITPGRLPDILYVDGKNEVRGYQGIQVVEPKADNTYKIVSAASIVAKVFRDDWMCELGRKYPQYGFGSHMGYGTHEHQLAVEKHGLLVAPGEYIHRRSYCKKFLARLST